MKEEEDDERFDVRISVVVDIDVLFHYTNGTPTSIDLEEYRGVREENGITTIYYGSTEEGDPIGSFQVKESIEEVKSSIRDAKKERDRNYQNFTPTLVENFDPNIDCLYERKRGIEKIKQKIFDLVLKYVDIKNDTHPVRKIENKKKSQEIMDEIVFRIQDYKTFLYDSKKDWDLNFEDYDY